MAENTSPALTELAESGSLCPECGGLHVTGPDIAIRALALAESTNTPLPWCSCECATCRPFRTAVERIAASSRSIDTKHFPEDSL